MTHIQKTIYTLVFLILLYLNPITAAPTITLKATKGTCPANGSITVTATGTSGTVFYAIRKTPDITFSTQQTSNAFTNLPSGEYRAAVYDASGETISSPIQLTNTTPATLGLGTPVPGNLFPTACADDGSISIAVTANTGVKPYVYHLKDGPTSQSDITTSANTAIQFLQLSTGIYSVDVTDACGTTITSNNISVVSKYNISGRDLDVYELSGTTVWDRADESPCGISFTRSTSNVYLKDVNGDTLFRRSWTKEMPGNYPVEGRVEYPEGSGQYTPWGPITKYQLPSNIYKPSVNKYRLQLKNPCDPTDIVTTSTYTLNFPYDVRQSTCGWEIFRNIKNYNCGNIIIELALRTNPSQKYTYTWDGSGDIYKLNVDNVPIGTYVVSITTAGDTYLPAKNNILIDPSTVLSVGMRADIFNYPRDKGCDFTTGAIRVTDVPIGNTIPITYSILSGPVSRNPVTSTQNNISLWDDLPEGTYQVEVDRGECGKTVNQMILTMPYSGFAAEELSYTPGSSCGKYKIVGKGWYLDPNKNVSTTTLAYGATAFDASTGTLISGSIGSAVNNTPITLAGEVGPGKYRVAFSSHSPGANSCYYLERFITIPPYKPLAVDVGNSGGVVCQSGFGELHVETTGGSGQQIWYRLRPSSSQNENDFTPYQTSPDFPNLQAGEYTVQVKDDCGLIITQNLNLISTATTADIEVSGAQMPSGTVVENCPGSDVTLTLKIIGRAIDIKWKYPNGTLVTEKTITITNFSNNDVGTYYASYSSGGCSWESSVTLHIKPNKPEFTYSNYGLCPPNSLDLTTLPPSSGSISGLTMSYWNFDYSQNHCCPIKITKRSLKYLKFS